jgi:NitT/TauT family transport system ATP-binding protein
MVCAVSYAIELSDVKMTYGKEEAQVEALENVHMNIEPGEFFSIVGPSGCGKTTVLKIIGGLIPPTSGRVAANGRPVQEARRNREFGFVFQTPALLPWRNVRDNVLLPLEIIGENSDSNRKKALDLLDFMGLTKFLKSYPSTLSGGMQQRVSIARALAFSAEMLLMDEPFGALDAMTRTKMGYELLRVWSQFKRTVVFVTHDIPEAVLLSDRIAVMSERPGKIIDILPVELPRPRSAESQNDPAFSRSVKAIREHFGLA